MITYRTTNDKGIVENDPEQLKAHYISFEEQENVLNTMTKVIIMAFSSFKFW